MPIVLQNYRAQKFTECGILPSYAAFAHYTAPPPNTILDSPIHPIQAYFKVMGQSCLQIGTYFSN
jgi:hypothetical protein